ncbi:MAG: preprotein translocase subunit YajC [Sulfobacillus thermosulfidooxidans]|uniref:Preprotein translocase subunit YajC n=1 Tax=Sulfobacillus thermotolerans TaxID=338644 RepID=A0ABM6RS62_9FIRM|nr:preprotein translocase subunit YajC [Sulfobacillus sp. hq2]AUW94268.1 preprotein translocase subunit YajC [Sulfobacillus thermotolerans]MCY0907830.1 preprotein translocase subunit YajC [Sulfobacillus thermotolerans]POB09454.1 preprotein translocase subunit YajC [Sulfobacillus sp. hq2]PSR37409.1 MAG: preprotein translocase subunit YajC [Sulfobacillus thermosulfidooxidans]
MTTHTTHGTSTLYWVFFAVLIGMTIWMFMQQSRNQKNRQKLQNSLQKGDQVVTVGGLIGTVASIDDKVVVLKIADDVKIKVLKTGIGGKYQDA